MSVTIDMFHVESKGYGGHAHTIKSIYLGEFRGDPAGTMSIPRSVGAATIILPPWETEVTLIYKASDVCTRRKFRVSSKALPKPIEFIVDVKYAVQLYDLNQSDTPNLELYTGDQQHPEEVCHYGTRKMVDALVAIDKAFGEAVKSGDLPADTPIIKVNDMSLPWGGSLKSYGKMEKTKSSHQSHKWGTDVDISYKSMTPQLRKWFKVKANELFTKAEVHNADKPYRHWHCDL